jgi:hypothetical protein
MDAYGQDKVFIADVKQEEGDALETREIINVRNVHKTYLLGLEGVTALRGSDIHKSKVSHSASMKENSLSSLALVVVVRPPFLTYLAASTYPPRVM